MAHLEDRWEKRVDGQRVRTARYGKGRRWRARYFDPDGHERSQTFARRADAERFLTTVSADVLRGRYVDPTAGKVCFADFAGEWLAARTFDESTRIAVEIRLRVHAFPTLGNRELRDLRPSTIQAWVRGLQGELSPRTVRLVFATVSSVLSAAVDDGLIAHNPCQVRSVRAPAVDAQRVAPWSVERVADVIAALPERYQALGVVAAGCGLRQGEAFGLRVCDIDFLRHRLHVEQQVKLVGGKLLLAPPKGRKTRTVPLPEAVAMNLAEHLRRYAAAGEELVFRSREGKPINRTYFNANVWKKALADAGVPRAAERHARAAALLRVGTDRRRRVGEGGRRVLRARRSRFHTSRLCPPFPVVRGPGTPRGRRRRERRHSPFCRSLSDGAQPD